MEAQNILREKLIKDIENYHESLGHQSWLPFYLDNCKTGISLNTISDYELYKIAAYMEDDYFDL